MLKVGDKLWIFFDDTYLLLEVTKIQLEFDGWFKLSFDKILGSLPVKSLYFKEDDLKNCLTEIRSGYTNKRNCFTANEELALKYLGEHF